MGTVRVQRQIRLKYTILIDLYRILVALFNQFNE